MNINATLLGQMITFAIFVWFTMRFVWPPITKALAERQQKIAEGLAAADRGKHELVLCEQKVVEHLKEAKLQADVIVDQATKRGNQIVDEAKDKAREEALRLVALAKVEIQQEVQQAKQQLKKQVAAIAMMGAQKILEHQIDDKANAAILDKLIAEL